MVLAMVLTRQLNHPKTTTDCLVINFVHYKNLSPIVLNFIRKRNLECVSGGPSLATISNDLSTYFRLLDSESWKPSFKRPARLFPASVEQRLVPLKTYQSWDEESSSFLSKRTVVSW